MRGKYLKFGLPFLITVVGSSFMLEQFQILRYELKSQKVVLDTMGHKFSSKKAKDRYEERLFKEMTDDQYKDWENKPIPKSYDS